MLNVFQLMIALGVDWLTITAGPPWPWIVAAPPTTVPPSGPATAGAAPSGHHQLAFTGNVDSSAPRGKAGTLLLDPEDFFIRQFCDGQCQSNETTATIIQNQLANQ